MISLAIVAVWLAAATESLAQDAGLAPVAAAPVGEREVAVLGSAGRKLLLAGCDDGKVRRTVPLPAEGSGLAVRGTWAYVTTDEPDGRVLAVDLVGGRVERTWPAGHMPCAPTLSRDGRTLFLANRFENRVSFLNLATGTRRTVDVVREPIALALSADGKRLFVANHLPCVRPFLDDENPVIAAELSVIDVPRARVEKTLELPNGSQGLRGMVLSPDSRHLAVTHILSNFTVPTFSVAGGAMNRNALSIVETDACELLGTAILDDPGRGAANPWGVCFSADGRRLFVTHAGTAELSAIDFAALAARLRARRGCEELFDADSLMLLAGIRQRVALGVTGPRAVCEAGGAVYAAGYFSDDLAAVDFGRSAPAVRRLALGPQGEPSPARLGEQAFNDATLCLEQWQSCGSCHPDGRSDALYWDLLNDGLGNTKNTKSLLMAAQTPPVMWRGVRADAGMAVESGIRHIQFVEPSEDQARAIEAYLAEMKVVPSPRLNAAELEAPKTESARCAKCHVPGVPRGTLSESARRGKTLFEGKAGCAGCHPHPYFTSLRTVDPGLGTGVPYDVPSLVEAWRSAPYLHHGDSLSLEETLTTYNHLQVRGPTDQLTPAELADLLEYLESL